MNRRNIRTVNSTTTTRAERLPQLCAALVLPRARVAVGSPVEKRITRRLRCDPRKFGQVLVLSFSLVGFRGAPMALVAGSSTFDVTMQVKLLVDRAGDPKKDYRDVVVWLVPIGTLHLRSLDAEGSPLCIVQRNKMFEPHLMVVPVGQVVEFCNRDAWVHYPFAFSNGLPVSLKPRQPDGRKAMKFDHTGVTYLFCEIHPQMSAVILAVDSPYFGVSDKWGRLSIRNVPAGTYSVHVWYEYAAPRVLRRVVELPPENCRRPALSISVVRRTESAIENHPQRSSVRGTP